MKAYRSTTPFVGRQNGSLAIDLLVAMVLLLVAVVPFGLGYLNSEKQMRQAYFRAVALELVDGEAEVLAAGLLHQFPEGLHDYSIQFGAVTNLPPGRFRLQRTGDNGVLEWLPLAPMPGGRVHRSFQAMKGVALP